jgi:uncharacterized RDD family membrane protein YckC
MSWGEYAYAGFWRRFAGMLIDGFVLGAVTSALAAFLGPAGLVDPIDPQALQLRPGWFPAAAGWSLVSLVVFLAYETAMLSTLGWTLGKRVVGVEVRGADGTILSVPRALGRVLGKFVSGLPLYLGFLWAAWDPRKQAWHDKFASFFALKRAWLEPMGQPRTDRLQLGQQTHGPAAAQTAWGIPGRPDSGRGPAAPQAAGPGAEEEVTVWQSGSPGRAPHQPEQGAPEPGWAASAGRGPTGAERDEVADPEVPAADPEDEPRPSEAAAAGAEPPGADDTEPRLSTDAEREEPGPAAPPPGEEPTILDRLTFAADEAGAGGAPGPAPAGGEEAATVPDGPAAGHEAGPAGQAEPAPEPGVTGVPPGAPETQPEEPAHSSPEDPNLVAISQAGLAPESATWLEQVAGQVDPRLDRLTPGWRSAPQAAAARACAFGLLLGHLARLYPHMATDLARVAEQHPSYSPLPAGSRLETLQGIAGDPGRATAWLGPLIGLADPERLRRLYD